MDQRRFIIHLVLILAIRKKQVFIPGCLAQDTTFWLRMVPISHLIC